MDARSVLEIGDCILKKLSDFVGVVWLLFKELSIGKSTKLARDVSQTSEKDAHQPLALRSLTAEWRWSHYLVSLLACCRLSLHTSC